MDKVLQWTLCKDTCMNTSKEYLIFLVFREMHLQPQCDTTMYPLEWLNLIILTSPNIGENLSH